MFNRFFSQDNATAKLSSWLILAASIISILLKGLQLPAPLNASMLIVVGVLTVIAQFFQQNKVIKNTSWLLLAYAVVDYLTTVQIDIPRAHELLLSLAAVIKLLTSFSQYTPGDSLPPSSPTPANQPAAVDSIPSL